MTFFVNKKIFFNTSILVGLLLLVFYRGGIPFASTIFFVLFSTALVFGATGGFLGKDFRDKETVMDAIFLAGGLVFLALFVLALIFSEARSYGAEELFLLVGGMLTFWLFSRLRLEKGERAGLLRGLIVIAVLSTMVGVFFFVALAQARFFGTFGAWSESFNAFPNAYANFLLLIVPVSTFFLIQSKKGGVWVWSVITAFLLSGLFLSLSRGAWLALFATVFLALAGLHARRKEFLGWFKKLVPAVVLLILFVLVFQTIRGRVYEVVTIHEKATFQSDEGTTSQDERVVFWMDSLQMMADRPWIGSGPNTFSFVYPEYQEFFGVISGHPHNLFLKIGVEEGIPAFILALLMVGGFFGLALFYGVSRSPYFWGLTASLLHNLVDFNLNFSSIVFLTFLFAGLVAGELREVLPQGGFFAKKLSYSRGTVLKGLMIFALAGSLVAVHELYYKIQFSKGMSALLNEEYAEADHHFESASKQVWEESLVLNWAEAKQGLGDLLSAKILLEDAVGKVADPRYYTLLGYLSDGDEAGVWFGKALAINSKNELEYFYNVVRTVGLDRAELTALLEMYTDQLSVNFHNTLLSANPKFAGKLFEWMILSAVSEEEGEALRLAYAEFLQVWEEQKLEFEVLYKMDL